MASRRARSPASYEPTVSKATETGELVGGMWLVTRFEGQMMGMPFTNNTMSGIMQLFRYLNIGLAIILVFVGGKMLASHYVTIPIKLSLGIIGAVLAIAILASVAIPQNRKAEVEPKHR